MAAIDKLYVHLYYEYDDLRKWAIAYYPELLFYFYDIAMTYQEWEDNVRYYVKSQMAIAKRDAAKATDSDGVWSVEQLIKHYKESVGYDCPIEQAKDEVDAIYNAYYRNAADWEDSYTCPILNTPFEIDKKLLWICPVPCVRAYLERCCGYKTRWYHKLFWRGKKHF